MSVDLMRSKEHPSNSGACLFTSAAGPRCLAALPLPWWQSLQDPGCARWNICSMVDFPPLGQDVAAGSAAEQEAPLDARQPCSLTTVRASCRSAALFLSWPNSCRACFSELVRHLECRWSRNAMATSHRGVTCASKSSTTHQLRQRPPRASSRTPCSSPSSLTGALQHCGRGITPC